MDMTVRANAAINYGGGYVVLQDTVGVLLAGLAISAGDGKVNVEWSYVLGPGTPNLKQGMTLATDVAAIRAA